MDQIVKNCAKGAALALDCSVEFTLAGPDFDDMVRVPLLEEKIKELFTSYGEPVGDPLPPGGSTDAGNVATACPTLPCLYLDFGQGLSRPLDSPAVMPL